MNLTLGEVVVWLIAGALAGFLAGMVVTFKKDAGDAGQIWAWAWTVRSSAV